MALYFKKHWSKGAKIAGAIFFAVLMFVNIKLTTDPNASGDIDLLGLKLSLYTPSTYACSGTCCPQTDAVCIVGSIYINNHYFKGTSGRCP